MHNLALRFCFAGIVMSIPLLMPALKAQQATPQTSPAPIVSPSGTLVAIPGGTHVTVQLVDSISSATAKVGDTFAISASNDVVVNDWIVIQKGAPGQGEVLSVDHAGSHGHPGSLGVQMDWIYATDGEKVRLTSERKTEEGESKAGVSNTMTIVSWAFLGLPGLFAHNFVNGKDIQLDSSHPLEAYVDSTVHVTATTTSNSDTGFAH